MSDGKRILIIDDSNVLGLSLGEHLSKLEGYSCVIESSADQGQTTALSHYFDTIVVDLDLSDGAYLDLCRNLRGHDVVSPIIVITGDHNESDDIKILDAGATDLMHKPLKLGVLVAKIRAHIRQFEHSNEAELQIGPFAFKASTKSLTNPNQPHTEKIRLTDKEAQILKFLYLHSGRTVNRDELLGEVWGYNAAVTTHTLETHVYRLRQKMEIDPAEAKILVTNAGGYQLFT